MCAVVVLVTVACLDARLCAAAAMVVVPSPAGPSSLSRVALRVTLSYIVRQLSQIMIQG